MNTSNNINMEFLTICKKCRPIVIFNFKGIDNNYLKKLYKFSSNPQNIRLLKPSSYKTAKAFLGNNLFNTYIDTPKINTLQNILSHSLKCDDNFKKSILEAKKAHQILLNKNIKHSQTTTYYKQTKSELIYYLKEKYGIFINKKDASNILKTNFGNKLNLMYHSKMSNRIQKIKQHKESVLNSPKKTLIKSTPQTKKTKVRFKGIF